MAKSKKNKKLLKLCFTCLELVLAVVAFTMLFVKFVELKDQDTVYKGTQVVFGYKKTSGTVVKVTLEYLKFSFMNLLPFILVIAAFLLACVKAIQPKLNTNIFKFVIFGLFVVAALLFFLAPNFIILGDTYDALGYATKDFSITVGAIVAGCASALGACVTCADVVIK